MKKNLFLLAMICLSFATSVSAQTGRYIETIKFDKHLPKLTKGIAYSILQRYDAVINKHLKYLNIEPNLAYKIRG